MDGSGDRVTWLGHASVLVRLGGTTILTDPVLRPGLAHLRRVGAGAAPGHPGPVDAVVISHLHHDHADLPSLRLVGRDTLVIGPPGSAAWLRGRGIRRATELPVGVPATVGDVEVTPVAAAHDGRRNPFFGPRAEAVGWVLRGPAGRPVYFAGDTDLHPVMDELADISLALVPVWGWGPNLGPGHLDPERAAEAVARIRPTLAVPIHWGTFFPLHLHRWPPLGRLLHEPPRHFAEHVRSRGLAADVVIPEPGLVIDVPAPPPPR